MQSEHDHRHTLALVASEQALEQCLREFSDHMSEGLRARVEIALKRCAVLEYSSD